MTVESPVQEKVHRSLWQQGWRFFSSVRLAIVLILILVGLSLIGTFVFQVPSEIQSIPNQYETWLQNNGQIQTGFWFPLLKDLNLFDVFHSIWFLGTGALLIISILVCSFNRFQRTLMNIAPTRLVQDAGFYQPDKSQTLSTTILSHAEIEKQITQTLRNHHFQPRSGLHTGTENLYLAADKHRFSPAGTYILHLSLILFITGYLVGSFFGFKDHSFTVAEGVSRDIGNNSELSLQLISFTDDYWPDGSPRDYRSTVNFIKNNQVVKSGTVQVNHPLSYQGINVFQSYFGPAVQLQISYKFGQALYQGNVALDGVLENHPYQRPSGGFKLSREGYLVMIIGRATNIQDTVLTAGQLGLEVYSTGSKTPLISTKIDKGVPLNAENIQITYLGDSKYSGFQISRDPGNSLIWTASGLFLLGLILVFYFPRRRIWIFLRTVKGQGQQIWLKSEVGRTPGANAELVSITRDLKSRLELVEKNSYQKED